MREKLASNTSRLLVRLQPSQTLYDFAIKHHFKMKQQSSIALADLLRIGIKSHQQMKFDSFRSAFEAYEESNSVQDAELSAWNAYVLYFVDCWMDAAAHQWQYHEPILEEDWIPLAKELIEAISESRSFEPLRLREVVLVNY